MNNNNRKRLNLYTQGQRWAARVLLVVGLCVSGTGSALAVPKLGTANIGQHVFVWGLLFFGLSSADNPQHPPLRCLSNDNALDRSCVPPSLAASAKEWSRLSWQLSILEEQVQKLEEEKEQQQTLQEYRDLQDLQKEKQELEEEKQELEEEIEASKDELKRLENQRQKLAKTIEGLHKEQAGLENQRQKFEDQSQDQVFPKNSELCFDLDASGRVLQSKHQLPKINDDPSLQECNHFLSQDHDLKKVWEKVLHNNHEEGITLDCTEVNRHVGEDQDVVYALLRCLEQHVSNRMSFTLWLEDCKSWNNEENNNLVNVLISKKVTVQDASIITSPSLGVTLVNVESPSPAPPAVLPPPIESPAPPAALPPPMPSPTVQAPTQLQANALLAEHEEQFVKAAKNTHDAWGVLSMGQKAFLWPSKEDNIARSLDWIQGAENSINALLTEYFENLLKDVHLNLEGVDCFQFAKKYDCIKTICAAEKAISLLNDGKGFLENATSSQLNLESEKLDIDNAINAVAVLKDELIRIFKEEDQCPEKEEE